MDEVTGKTFRPNLLLSTKSMGRGMGGQMRKMAAAMNMFGSTDSYRMGVKPMTESTFAFED